MTAQYDKRSGHGVPVHDDQAPAEAAAPVPVENYVVQTAISHPVAIRADSEFSTHQTKAILPQQSIQILPLDPNRYKATIWVAENQGVASTFQSSGAQTSPTAGTVITSVTGLAAGTYNVAWSVGLGGTTSGTDISNFELNVGATPVVASSSGSGSGSFYPQPMVSVTVPANGTVSITAIATATTGAVYRAQLVLTQQDVAPFVVLADSLEQAQSSLNFASATSLAPAQPQGALLQAGGFKVEEYDGEILYAVNCDPAATALVSVLIERAK